MPDTYRFDQFVIDPANRQLSRAGARIDLNARYFDALALLVQAAGQLVTKDRFLGDVWRGVPVTDEALTQCIKTLRRQLGDDASAPRFIETVPRHGYRFIAAVSVAGQATVPGAAPASVENGAGWRDVAVQGGAAALGGGAAGVVGGLLYGFAISPRDVPQPAGGASALLVLVCVALLLGLVGGAGVGVGIAIADRARRARCLWSIVGGAGGGLVVGACARLLGLDAFNLLLGQAPGDITGGAEGALLGAAIGFGKWWAGRAGRATSLERSAAPAALAAGVAGALIPLLGGQLLGGSLQRLALRFPASGLRIDQVGRLFGEPLFGPVSQSITGALEGLLFGAGVAAAMLVARRGLGTRRGED